MCVKEREHAEELRGYQNKYEGKVMLRVMMRPPSEFDNDEKGGALHAMELAMALEKLTTQKLQDPHVVPVENDDFHVVEFIESEFLTEQVESIKNVAEYVAQLRGLGKGHRV